MSFKATITAHKDFVKAIDLINKILPEALMIMNEEGITLQGMDPANVSYLQYRLLRPVFTEFFCEKEERIGIILDELNTPLKRAKPDDIIMLCYEDQEMTITILGKRETDFSISLLCDQVMDKHEKVPVVELNTKVILDSDVLAAMVEDVKSLGETLLFVTTPEVFKISSRDDTHAVNAKSTVVEITMKDDQEETKSKYSIDYLNKIIGAKSLSSKVLVEYQDDNPVRIEYSVVDKHSLWILTAPWIDSM